VLALLVEAWVLLPFDACVPLLRFEKCEHETPRTSNAAAAAVPNTFAIIALLLW
jgi:hypothetical protein